jgi:EpsD family peptidyl-prolyl cis-trans isomerase
MASVVVAVSRRAGLLVVMAGLSMLIGCTREPPRGGATQVFARVGGVEITALQFNHAIKMLGVARPNEAVRREVAEKLIDRELAVQQALSEKLDRQPEVLLQLEEARRDVLARAYAERIAASASKPSESEAARFYARHPELFASRKIFHLREAALPQSGAPLAEVKARFAQKQSFDQVGAWLRQQGVGFNEQVAIRAAEQLPLESLPTMNGAAQGQTVLFESPRGLIVYQIISARAAPVSWESAKPIIRDYLNKQAGKRAVDAQLKHLRGSVEVAHAGQAPLATTGRGGDDPGGTR